MQKQIVNNFYAIPKGLFDEILVGTFVGWHANMERQGREASVMTPPATDGGMSQ